jgi:uncharacterized protein (DUF1501 family)
MSFNRRSFIRYASLAAAGHIAGVRPFGALNAMAQSTPGYKALVCLFLYGGNDSNNMVVPFDTAGYQNYASIRGPLTLSQSSLLQLGPTPDYALHPSLSNIRSLFNSGNAAIVANVGTLVQPITRAQYLAGQLPTPGNLFSHPDQQLEWQNGAQDASSPTGWAGRIADELRTTYNSGAQIPMITTVDGDALFCDGANTTPISIYPGSAPTVRCSEGAACAARQAAAQQLLTFSSGVSLVQPDNTINANGYQLAKVWGAAASSVAPLTTAFPGSSLGAQLQQIAQVIQLRQALGVNRQIFFAGLGNFDTHGTQLETQAALLAQVGPAMAAFYEATQELGLANQITTFTMSDFSRAFQPNSNYGSDHAWGGHHIVIGGAVKGGKIYGTFPTLALGGPDDSGSNGRWVPSIGSAQYAATLASWFGVSTSNLPAIFPNIGSFSTANLGFIG